MEGLTSGELADSAGVTVETIRYYERRGLLREPERTASGYRQYKTDDVWRLAFIRRAQDHGFTLAEIGDLLEIREAAAPDGVRSRVEAKIAELEANVASTRRRIEELRQLVCTCSAGHVDACLDLRVEEGA